MCTWRARIRYNAIDSALQMGSNFEYWNVRPAPHICMYMCISLSLSLSLSLYIYIYADMLCIVCVYIYIYTHRICGVYNIQVIYRVLGCAPSACRPEAYPSAVGLLLLVPLVATYICVYIYIYIDMYIYIYIYRYVYTHVCTYIYIYTHDMYIYI